MDINILPPELLYQIFSYLNPLELFSLKLAGIRYVTENIRSLTKPPFSKYIEHVRAIDDSRPVMLLAAGAGHETLLRALLEAAIDSDILFKQIRFSTPWRHRKLIRERENAELCKQVAIYGMSAIHQAAECGQDLLIVFLLSKGLSVEHPDARGSSPLHYAARAGRNTTIKFLLKNGARLSVRDYDGYTAVHEAAKSGHEQTVKLLLDQGAEADTQSYDDNEATPLWLAVTNSHTAIVRILLDNNASANRPYTRRTSGPYQTTLLHHAVCLKLVSMIPILLDHGADLEARDQDQNTPLLCAARYANEETANLLVDKGADIEARDAEGHTPLLCAVHNHAGREIVNLLLDKGADIEAKNSLGDTSLLCAVKHADKETVNLLLDKGADVNYRGSRGQSPLHISVEQGYSDVITLLLEHGARGFPDANGWTPADVARHLGFTGLVQKHPRLADTDGRTPTYISPGKWSTLDKAENLKLSEGNITVELPS